MFSLRGVQLLLAISTTFLIVSCSGVTNRPVGNSPQSTMTTADCRSVSHQLGETKVCGKPQRVVALGPNMLELLLTLDLQPVGYADYILIHKGDYDNPSQQIPYLGNRIDQPIANVGLSYTPSLEALLKVKPDLILGPELSPSLYATLSEIAPTLLLKRFDTESNLKAIATAVGKPEQVEPVLKTMQQKVAAARQEFAPIVASHPEMLMLVFTQGRDMRLISSTESLCGSLVKNLGFQLIHPPELTHAQANDSLPIALEKLPQLNQADSVILLGANLAVAGPLATVDKFASQQLESFKQLWEKNAIAQSLQASKAGRTYFIPAYVCLGLPGPIGTELYLNELKKQIDIRSYDNFKL